MFHAPCQVLTNSPQGRISPPFCKRRNSFSAGAVTFWSCATEQRCTRGGDHGGGRRGTRTEEWAGLWGQGCWDPSPAPRVQPHCSCSALDQMEQSSWNDLRGPPGVSHAADTHQHLLDFATSVHSHYLLVVFFKWALFNKPCPKQ